MSTKHDHRMHAILYVDDEEQSLKYFRKAFEKDFTIHTACSGDEGLALLERHGPAIGVMISDQRMPGKSGVDVLSSVRKTHPSIIRILTTAYSDLDSAIAAVNSGAIYKYIVKPWDIPDLGMQLKRAMDFFLVQQERDALLREKLNVLQRLIVTDRVRSLAALAAGLGHHIRNSMVALSTFLDLFSDVIDGGDGRLAPEDMDLTRSVWDTAQMESKNILAMVKQVAESIAPPSYDFHNQSTVQAILQNAVENCADLASQRGVSLRLDVVKDLPLVRKDGGMVEKLFGILLARNVRDSARGTTVSVCARDPVDVWGTAGVRVRIVSDGDAWTEQQVSAFFTAFAPSRDDPRELGLDLLSAFFICQHHGGDIIVHRAPPDGPGFEILLPFDPEQVTRPSVEDDFLEKLLTRFERADILAAAAE